MTPLKVGDRVMVYGCVKGEDFTRNGGRATIASCLPETNEVCVYFDDDDTTYHYIVYSKQCKRLVKKLRRRIYISADNLHRLGADEYVYMSVWKIKPLGIESVEFAEVRKKK